MDKLDRIDDQIAALEAERLRLLTQPADVYEDGDVVWFTKTFGRSGSHRYTYAAVKVGGRWYVTQSGTRETPMTWGSLLDFVSDGELWAAVEWERVQ